MPPHANYLAFAIRGDIERDRGDFEEAMRSYEHAMKWTKRMSSPESSRATDDMEWRFGNLNEAIKATSYSTNRTSQYQLCNAAGSKSWRAACRLAKRDSEAAALHAKLTTLLEPGGISMQEVLSCDKKMEQSQSVGQTCFEQIGFPRDTAISVQLAALQFELLIEDYIKD